MAIKDWFEGDRWRPIGSIKSLKSRSQKLAIDYGIDQKATALLDAFSEVSVSAENAWGDFRQWMKQYPSPDTPEELLNQTREELLYVVACILQIPPRSAAKWVDRFGKTLTAKLAAAGITTYKNKQMLQRGYQTYVMERTDRGRNNISNLEGIN